MGWPVEGESPIRSVGTWLLLCTCMCSCHTCLGVSVPRQRGGEGLRAGPLTCLTDSILRIDCRWSGPELSQDSGPWLLFTSNQAPGGEHRCVFQGSTCTMELPPEEMILPTDNFTITLHRRLSGKEQVSLVDRQYLPWRHIKLDPPSDLRSNVSSGYCVLSWSVSPVLEPMSALLSYELAFRRRGEAWEQARYKDRIVGVTRLILEAVELSPGSTYEARLRVQMAVLDAEVVAEEPLWSQWSEWSQPVCFPSPQEQGPRSPWRWLHCTLVAVSVCLLLTGLTCLLLRLSPRVKRTFYQNVPSPAVFFQPLYSVHNGNFQTWAGADRVCLQPGQDCANSSPGTWEAITLLTCGPGHAWTLSGLNEEEGSPGGVLQAEGGQPSGYLPQEDWLCLPPTRLAPPESEGSSDYCALGCCGGCHASVFPRNMQNAESIPDLARGLSYVQQTPETQQRAACKEAGHSQRCALFEDPQGIWLSPILGQQQAVLKIPEL
ncbi:interleukin-9 receptor [Dipodomys spectabilis]|uniref:interleukin-9 receptor n=1 Tax=Dipodomys spectabilis TaxID=105255 RepID=UPI001C5440E8|nr:interleukin-9 receptor [Dipodomys spectabilis]